MKEDRIRTAMEKNLSGLAVTEEWHQNTCRAIMKGECKMKHKYSLVFALTLALILAVTGTACALTIASWVKEQIQPYADAHGWGIEERLAFLHLMQDWGVEVDEEKLSALERDYAEKKDHLTLDELDELEDRAGEMIYAWYLPLHGPFEVEQQEQYPMPSDQVLYAYLYRTQNPEATDAEIAEAFETWRNEWQNTHADKAKPEDTRTLEEKMRENFENLLYERLFIDEQTLRRFEITLTFDEETQTYCAKGQISRAYLTEDQIERFIFSDGDAYRDGPLTDGESMFWYWHYDAEGNSLGENLEQMEYDALIPISVYRSWGEGTRFRDSVRAFRNCTLEQRAAFSQTYKPLVDAWLEAHPGYLAYLGAHPEQGGSTYKYTRHWYGLPPTDALQQEDIQALARDWYFARHPEVSAAFFEENMDIYTFYVLTDSGPEWKVTIFPDQLVHDSKGWTEEEWDWWRISDCSVVFDAEGKLLRESGALLPEDECEGLR